MKKLYVTTVLSFITIFTTQGQTEEPIYDLANNCYSVTYLRNGREISFEYSGVSSSYYFKPAGLGEYLFYGTNNEIFARSNSRLGFISAENAEEGAIWIPESDGNGGYRIKNKGSDAYLGRNFLGTLIGTVSQSRATIFKFEPNDNCEDFPEASISATQNAPLKVMEGNRVWGMADIHTHLFGNIGYGRYFNAGKPFSPYGIQDALRGCNKSHGLSGTFDIYATSTGDQQTTLGHRTAGYPNFSYWPSHTDFNHQKGYYQWLNRARLGGLRLMTVLSVQNEVLHEIYNEMVSQLRAFPTFLTVYNATEVLNSMEVHDLMVENVNALVDYVDAQEGGPGQGWLQIAHTPEQARQIIAEGKLALVMGMELEAPFNCITTRDGSSNCTRAYLEEQLDAYREKGISHIFLNHHWDNDFSGARQFETFLELSNTVYNDHTFEWEAADDGEEGIFNTYVPLGAAELEGINQIAIDIITGIFNVELVEPNLPPSETGMYRNTAGLNDLGKVFIEECMQRGIMIDFGHSTKKAVEEAYTILDEYNYPPLFTHSANFDEMTHVLEREGVLSPMLKANGFENYTQPCEYLVYTDFAELITFDNQINAQSRNDEYVGIPFTSDLFAGVPHMNGPRFNNETNPCTVGQSNPVSYPFTSHDGSVVFEQQQTGNRIFDFNTDGLAHMGLLPDLIQDLKQQGYTDQDLEVLFNGAEEYLRLWERSINASQNIQDSNIEISAIDALANRSEATLEKTVGPENMAINTMVYPTLIENTFNLKTDHPTTLQVSVYDAQGKIYYQETLNYLDSAPKAIDRLQNAPSGVFLVRVQDQLTGKYAVYKVVKK